MGAYQRIELPGHPPILDAMGQVAQSLGQLGDQRHQQAQEAQARKRQEHADFASAYMQAKKLADSGDHAGASALLARYKGRYGESPSAHATPSMGQPPPQGQPQGGSPMPDAMEFPAPPMPREEGPDGVGPDGRPVSAPIDPGFVDSLPMGAPSPQQAPAPNPLMAAAQRPQAPDDHPLVAANQASKAKDQARGHGVFYFTPPGEGGTEQSYDPQAVREQHIAQRTAEVERMVAKAPPEVQAVYAELAPMLAMDDKADTGDIVRMIGQRMTAKQQEAALAGRAHEGELNRTQRGELRREGFGVSMRNADVAAAAREKYGFAMNPPGYKDDQSTRQDSAALEKAVNDQFAHAGGGKAVAGMDALHAANANINAKGPNAVLAHRDAMIQLARYFRGTTPTEGEMKLLYHNLGGTPAAMDAFIKSVKSGEMSDAAVENLRESVRVAYVEAEDKRNRLLSGLKHRLSDPGSEFRLMGPAARAQVAAIAANFGMEDIGDAFPAAEAEEGPAPALGEHRIARAAAKKKPAKSPTKAPQAQASGADAEAVRWAKDPANASKPQAQAILRENGLLK